MGDASCKTGLIFEAHDLQENDIDADLCWLLFWKKPTMCRNTCLCVRFRSYPSESKLLSNKKNKPVIIKALKALVWHSSRVKM